MTEPGLDFAFLQFIGATPESQQKIQRFYVPYFKHCTRVLDLGCGSGDFLELLRAEGVAGVGVDSDPQCCADARGRGLTIEEVDVLTYLATAAPEQFDGVFCAHLVEHLPYEAVLAVVRGALRVLRPGGCLILATPNARAIFAHLQMFYMHFGHVSFYHPELLKFFLHHCGLVEVQAGVNPFFTTPQWGDLRGRVLNGYPPQVEGLPRTSAFVPPIPVSDAQVRNVTARPAVPEFSLPPPGPLPPLPPLPEPLPPPGPLPPLSAQPPLRVSRTLPMQANTPVHRVVRVIKNWVARWFVLPLVDDLALQVSGYAQRVHEYEHVQRVHEYEYAQRVHAYAQRMHEQAALQQAWHQSTVLALHVQYQAHWQALHAHMQTQINAAQNRLDSALDTFNTANANAINATHSLHMVNQRLAELNGILNEFYVQFGQVDRNWTVLNQGLAMTAERFGHVADALEQIDESWECYVVGYKPETEGTGAEHNDG